MYKPDRYSNLRDEINAAQIANERPCLATRFPCSPDPDEVVPDTTHNSSDAVAEFNRRLREG